LKDDELEMWEKLSSLVDKRIETKWERRFNELKDYMLLLTVLLILTWFEIFLILLGIL
jgi:hypothetical protein